MPVMNHVLVRAAGLHLITLMVGCGGSSEAYSPVGLPPPTVAAPTSATEDAKAQSRALDDLMARQRDPAVQQ